MEENFVINPELKNLLPPLSPEEYQILKESIISEGCRTPLLVWNGMLVDGHNRYEICTEYNIPFLVDELQSKSIEDVKVWIIDNQKGRRNLTDGWKYELTQVRKEILIKQGRDKISETQTARHAGITLSTIDKDTHNTQKEIAEELGWSTGKVAMADKVWREAGPDVKEKIKSGELSFNQAYNDIRKEEKIEKRQKEIEETKKRIETENLTITDLYDVIVLDPPWPYGREYDPENSRVANPYPEMSLDEIGGIDLPAKDNCVLFLWTTHAFIESSFILVKRWGFDYKAIIVWDKEKMGMGNTIRMQCEFCLLAIKGIPLITGSSTRDIIREARREHSRKPDGFYDMVLNITNGKRIDYFSREKREGFVQYGAETDKF